MGKKIPGLTLKACLTEAFPLTITKSHIMQLAKFCISFETRKDHPLALNSPYLGVHKAFFTDKDQDTLFIDIFHIGRTTFNRTIQSVPIIDPVKRKVWSNPYSIFTIWVAHCIYISEQLTQAEKELGLFSLFKMWIYKFFTSMVNRKFPHKTDEAVMRAVIDSLNNKFDIIRLGTWKAVIEERAKELYDKSSIHLQAIAKFDNDKAITYAITDTSTRLKSKINLITNIFHTLKKENQSIRKYTTADTVNGEKLLKDLNNSLDSAISRINTQITNVHQWIDTVQVDVVASMIKVKPILLRNALKYFSDVAAQQLHMRKTEATITKNDTTIIVGCRLLTEKTIHTTIRRCIISGTNVTSKRDILDKTANMYRSSQLVDEDITQIKDSMWYLLADFKGTTRENTKLTLRIGIILYIVLRALNYV
jgi:hypothetical protein